MSDDNKFFKSPKLKSRALDISGIIDSETKIEKVNHPNHYGGQQNIYETIKVIDAWDLNFSLGNAVKYISRAGKKDCSSKKEDLEKAIWYIKNEIKKL